MAAVRDARRFVDEDDDRHDDIPLRFDDRRRPNMSASERRLIVVAGWAVPMIGLLAVLIETVGRVPAV